MRKQFLLLLLICNSFLFAQTLKFADSKKNFGFVKQGKPVIMKFSFKNDGKAPLIISETKVACTCTTVDFPKQPILPGQSAEITITFDTKSVYDRQNRTVEIISNATNSPSTIRFKGVVLR